MRMKRILLGCVTSVFLMACSPGVDPSQGTDSSPELTEAQQIISDYVQSFNDCDLQAASTLMHEEIEWLTISGSSVDVTTQGKAALIEALTAYMTNGCSTVSTLSDWSVNGPHIAVKETAGWMNADGESQSQSATAVYEIEDQLVRRVWYFPAHRGGA